MTNEADNARQDLKEPDQAAAAKRERNASRRSLLAQFSSVLALAISFLALAVGAYQTRLMQGPGARERLAAPRGRLQSYG
jgi:hypothetical protein